MPLLGNLRDELFCCHKAEQRTISTLRRIDVITDMIGEARRGRVIHTRKHADIDAVFGEFLFKLVLHPCQQRFGLFMVLNIHADMQKDRNAVLGRMRECGPVCRRELSQLLFL